MAARKTTATSRSADPSPASGDSSKMASIHCGQTMDRTVATALHAARITSIQNRMLDEWLMRDSSHSFSYIRELKQRTVRNLPRSQGANRRIGLNPDASTDGCCRAQYGAEIEGSPTNFAREGNWSDWHDRPPDAAITPRVWKLGCRW